MSDDRMGIYSRKMCDVFMCELDRSNFLMTIGCTSNPVPFLLTVMKPIKDLQNFIGI